MERVPLDQVQVIVVADESRGTSTSTKGRLLEDFIARLLNRLGYTAPTTSNVNVTSAGIELDVVASHRVTGSRLIAECKAYSANVPAHMLDAFFGKLSIERIRSPQTQGVFVALPRLTANGEEQARLIERNDTNFRYFNADVVAGLLAEEGMLKDAPEGYLLSDPVIVVTEHGVYQGALRLDEDTRTSEAAVLWGVKPVPQAVLDAVKNSSFAAGMPVVAIGLPSSASIQPEEPMMARVAASSSDFEYQLPAAPEFFVGRRRHLAVLKNAVLSVDPSVFVFNAQSGWGKSSLALRLGKVVEQARGASLILDARTASTPSFVAAALRELAQVAERRRLLRLPADAAFGTTNSSLRSLKRAEWRTPRRPLYLFFDQFENVFRDSSMTKSFRDLALAARDVAFPLKLGFAWKTDLVGWTEGHPYQLRDEIRSAARVVVLDPLGPADISTLLTRLQNTVGQKLDRDLRDRLREYSGGLPWLFKKLAGHIIDELARGTSQTQLLAEALNVQGLFDADLAQLSPDEASALREIARLAPIPISELSDSIEMPVVQSLLDGRLIVQVGERLDTYWDIFRDYLNTGTVPIKDAFILRLNPSTAMGTILRAAIDRGGSLAVSDAMALLRTSEAVVFNAVRDLRLLGLVAYEPGLIRVGVNPSSQNAEADLQHQAGIALRRHRAYELILDLLDDEPIVTFSEFAERLAAAFPAVTAKPSTWDQYARAFAYWFAYARLVGLTPNGITTDPDDTPTDLALLSREGRVSVSNAFPQSAAGPAVELGVALAQGSDVDMPAGRRRKAKQALESLGLLAASSGGALQIDSAVFGASGVDAVRLKDAITEKVPGAKEAFSVLESDPSASPLDIGVLLRDAQRTSWTPTTTHNAGKHFRSWARHAGVRTTHVRSATAPPQPSLFDERSESAGDLA